MPLRESFKTHEEYLEWYRDYRKKNRERIKKTNAKWRAANPGWNKKAKEVYLAHRLVNEAIKAGLIVRQPCEVCGTNELNRAHHDDYTKPLQVRWFCESHHRLLHKKMTNLKTQQTVEN